MPTIYQTCGAAIEKIGPSDGGMSGRGRPIAFCADANTANLFVDALEVLKYCYDRDYGTPPPYVELRAILTRAGLI